MATIPHHVFQVRAARAEDLASVRALLTAADLPLDGLDDQFGEAYAVAESGEAVVGAVGVEVHGPDGLLRSAVVAPAWRGVGLGESLTRNRIGWARAHGLRAIYLLTTTAGDWFARFGFVETARDGAPAGIRASREFAEACPATARFMSLTLNI